MNVINNTRINTKQLSALVREVARRELFTPEQIALLKVRVVYRKRTHARQDNQPGGYAYYNSNSMCLKFVKGIQPDPVAVAKTTAHELAHCQGVHHGKAMSNSVYGWKQGWREHWAWAASYPLEMRPEPSKIKPKGVDKASLEIEKCNKALDVWKRKAKLAATKLKVWKRKLGYYEKRLAAMSPAQELAEALVSAVEQADSLRNPNGDL